MLEYASSHGEHSGVYILPGWQVEAGLGAAKDVDLGLGSNILVTSLDPLNHTGPHVMLLGGRHHPLEDVLNLLVQPGQLD